MDRGYYRQWRKEMDSAIWLKPPLYGRVWLWVKMSVDFQTGILRKSMQKIAEAVEWVEDGHLTTPNKRQIHTILHWMEAENMILLGSNDGVTEINVLNWHIYNESYSTRTNDERTTNERRTNGLLLDKVIALEALEALDSKASPAGAGGQASATPPPAASPELLVLPVPAPVPVPDTPEPEKPRNRTRTPKAPPDPRTNSGTFLHRVETEYPYTVIVWVKDGGAVKTLLAARLRAGVDDPQAEMWEAWVRFAAGDIDDTLKDYRTGKQRRAHDIPTFVGNYALILERETENPPPHPETSPEVPVLPDTPDELRGMWESVLSRIEGQVSQQSYKTWFLPANLLSLGKERAVVGVPSLVFSEWIRENYLNLLQSEISSEVGSVVSVNVESPEDWRENGFSAAKAPMENEAHESSY